MLMVILGAGASYDSSAHRLPTDPEDSKKQGNRPPLANYLFQIRKEFQPAWDQFPQIHGLAATLMPHGNRSVEETLQRYRDQAKDDPQRLGQLLAVRYYIQTVFRSTLPGWLSEVGGFTNYEALLEQIRHHHRGDEPVLLVSFNYDILLEDAVTKHFGGTFRVMADYVSRGDFRLFKVHGSQNWGRRIGSAPTMLFQGNRDPRGGAQQMIANVERIGLTDTFEVYETAANGFSGPPLYPAIAIPITNKAENAFECPHEHLRQLTELIPNVKKVLTVGWRGREQNFLSLFATLRDQIAVTTIADTVEHANETFKAIESVAAHGIGARGYFDGFSQTVRDERLNNFLAL